MEFFQDETQPRVRKVALLFLGVCFFTLACLPRLFSLDAHWSSDEAMWLRQSAQFMSAVKNGEFSETGIAYHPGVTTMWLAGPRTFFTDPPHLDVKDLVFARWFIGIIVWIGIGIACLLLYRLFGQWIAFTSFVCLAYSPFFLAQTRRVMTDALATVFILLLVLLFLLYCQNRHSHRYLVFSGVAFGLALLSKSHTLILLPWILLCLFLFWEKQTGNFWTSLAEGICFLNCAALTVLGLWPVFWTPSFGITGLGLFGLTFAVFRGMEKERCSIWIVGIAVAGLLLTYVQAIPKISSVLESITWAVTTPHEVEHFFLGKVINDPGWLFYPFVLTIKSTPLMLPLAILGCILLWKHRKESAETSIHFKTGIAFVAGILLFTICLSTTSKKFNRYLLPVFPMLEILAAIGLVEGLKWSYRALRTRFRNDKIATYKETLTVIACIGFFFIQVFPVLARHPYYGTYYNLCWKTTDITRIITVGDASGLDIAAKYLNNKPEAQDFFVEVSPLAAEFMWYYFQGYSYSTGRGIGLKPNYEVVYIRDSQVKRAPQAGTRGGQLEYVITLNGIDHVWIYLIPKK